MSKSIRTEQDRRIAELEALVAGITGELHRVLEQLEKCEAKLGELVVAVNRIGKAAGVA